MLIFLPRVNPPNLIGIDPNMTIDKYKTFPLHANRIKRSAIDSNLAAYIRCLLDVFVEKTRMDGRGAHHGEVKRILPLQLVMVKDGITGLMMSRAPLQVSEIGQEHHVLYGWYL